jgi:hypothetical protein
MNITPHALNPNREGSILVIALDKLTCFRSDNNYLTTIKLTFRNKELTYMSSRSNMTLKGLEIDLTQSRLCKMQYKRLY